MFDAVAAAAAAVLLIVSSRSRCTLLHLLLPTVQQCTAQSACCWWWQPADAADSRSPIQTLLLAPSAYYTSTVAHCLHSCHASAVLGAIAGYHIV
jgi:hypothetical protein